MKYNYQGVTVTSKYLTVYFTSTYGRGAYRFDEVKVPIEALLRPEVTEAVDKAVRKRLMLVWDATGDDELPL